MCAFVSPLTLQFPSAQRSVCCRTRLRRLADVCQRRRRAVLHCSVDEPATPESVKALLTSPGKREQQHGLILVRQLPPETALELLLLSVRTSNNDFIRATAAVAIGELDLSDPELSSKASATLAELLAIAEDYSVRSAAAAGMGYATSAPENARTAMVEALTRALLEDSDWQVHFSCLVSLGSLSDKRAMPALLPWLQSKNDLLVQATVGALGDIGEAAAIPDLLSVLGASDMMTRQRLAQTLGRITTPAPEPAIIDALRTLSKDQSFIVREAAVYALESLGVKDAQREETMSDEQLLDKEVANILEGDEAGNAGESAGEALRRRLERSFNMKWTGGYDSPLMNSGYKHNTEEEVETLTNESLKPDSEPETPSTDMDLYKTLVDDLRDGDSKTRVLAAISLRRFEGRLASAAVLETRCMDANSAPQRLRSVCAALLGQGGEIAALVDALETDPDQNVRSAVCDALAAAGGGPEAIRACIHSLETDEHWLVRISAAITLGAIAKGESEAEKALIRCLTPSGMHNLPPPQLAVIQRHAVTALGFLGSQQSIPVFRDILADGNADMAIRHRIAAALSGIEYQESVSLARSLLEDSNTSVAEMAQSSLDVLAKRGYT